MKNITIIILTAFFIQLSFSQTMYIHTRSNGIDSIMISQIDSITFSVSVQGIPLELTDWKCFTSVPAYSYLDPAPGVYEKVTDGLKIYGNGYRGNENIHPVPTSQYPIMNKTIYVKWKANGGGQFMGVGVNIYKDTTFLVSPDSGIMNLTTHHSYLNSYVITEDMWYYTRVVLSTDHYTAITATGNYDNLGGTVIQSKSRPISQTYNVLTFGLWDTYAGTTPYAILGEARIE